jgi:hypothetical protein
MLDNITAMIRKYEAMEPVPHVAEDYIMVDGEEIERRLRGD